MSLPASASSPLSVSIPSHVSRVRQFYISGSTRSIFYRVRQLRQLLKLITDNEKQIIQSMQTDYKRAATEVQLYEIDAIKHELESAIDSLPCWAADQEVPSPVSLLPAKSFIQYQPYGVVLIIGPFNFPFQLIMGPLIGSIAAGNVAVIKPSSLFPTMSKVLGELIPKYLDPNSIAWIIGSAAETTALLTERFDYIFFTGSETVGKIILEAAAKHLTPTSLELGGKSPTIVHSDADLALAARRIVWGKYLNCSFQCIGVDYVLCHESVKAKFLDLLKQTITQFYGKDPKSSPDYACVISDRQFQRIVGLIESDRSGLVFGGNYDATTRYVAPTIIEATGESKSMQEEIFGPILPLLTYKDIAEAINFINARPKPLALYCFSNSSSVNDRVLRSTTSGGASINDTLVHFGNKNLPFGGVGPSGMGSYHGKFSFLAFSHARGVVEKSVYGDAPARYPPYAADKLKLVQFFNSIKRFDSHTIRKLIRFVLIPLVLILIFRRLGLRVVFQRK